MLSRILPRLDQGTVVAYLALFVALGGGSYAAVKVNGKDIADKSIAGKKLKDRTITTAKLKIKAGQLPAGQPGATGAQGPKGDPGEPGLSEYERVEVFGPVAPGDTGVVLAASCPAGKKIIGGGGLVQDRKLHITFSFPQSNDKWGLTAALLPGQTITSPSSAAAIAICAKVG